MDNTELITIANILAIKKYGIDNQTIVAIEELSELQKELCKFQRGIGNKEHITEEIADVILVVAQLITMFDCQKEVEDWQLKKAKRLLVRVGLDE